MPERRYFSNSTEEVVKNVDFQMMDLDTLLCVYN
jgi:hypothetical protein